MDSDTADLIAQLCTRIGMIMEDTSVLALTVSGMGEQDRKQAIDRICIASEHIGTLAAAARTLADQGRA